ncbi:MAG: peptidoglycan editing factor PgeF [Actinomycetes bacterium]
MTGRSGGVSRPPYDEANLALHVGDDDAAVRANRAALADALAPDVHRLVFMDQAHGARVSVLASLDDRPDAGVDAMVTTVPALALAVLVADCVPVVMSDAAAGVVAVAHAGRPGLVAGVVPATLEAMGAVGAHPDRTVALLGPAVCGTCYEVPPELAADVARQVPAARCVSRTGTPALDVAAGVAAQLRAGGVRQVQQADLCTQEAASCFSYRRDRTTGRFAGLVWLGSAMRDDRGRAGRSRGVPG